MDFNLVEVMGVKQRAKDEEHLAKLRAQKKYAEKYFEKRGWNISSPKQDQIREVQAQPEFINPSVGLLID